MILDRELKDRGYPAPDNLRWELKFGDNGWYLTLSPRGGGAAAGTLCVVRGCAGVGSNSPKADLAYTAIRMLEKYRANRDHVQWTAAMEGYLEGS